MPSFGLELAVTLDHVDLIFAHEELDAFAHFVCDAAAAVDDSGEIHCSGGFDAELF